jgi:pseudouridine synthase
VHSLAPPQVITAAIFQTKDLHRHFICNSSSVTPRIRVNKALGERFSRRQADELVRAGRVTVNGKLVAPGARVTVTDVIAVDGEQLRLSPRLFVSLKDLGSKESHFVYFKYWKPVGVECTTARDCPDNILDVSGLGEWAEKNQRRLFNVGRLDKDSTGIILLTDDGRLANALLGKNSGLAKSYLVAVNKPVTDDVVDALEQGFLIETEYRHDKKVKKIRSPTLPCAVRLGKNSFEIEMDIYEGRNRQIRRMLESLGYQVQRLHRYSFCSIELGPELQEEGTWAPLNSKELVVIHQALQKLANKESH